MSVFDLLPDIFSGLLGDPVVFTPAGGAPIDINAIIQWDSLTVTPFDGPGTNCSRVVAHVRTQDVGGAPEGGQLASAANAWRGATIWKIVQPITRDGKGMSTLTLESTV